MAILRKVFIVKYALTKGIIEVENAQLDEEGSGTLSIQLKHQANPSILNLGRDWCTTKEEAIKLAEEMRTKAIDDLNRKIKKVWHMKFEEVIKE